jgi:hypothetical protein
MHIYRLEFNTVLLVGSFNFSRIIYEFETYAMDSVVVVFFSVGTMSSDLGFLSSSFVRRRGSRLVFGWTCSVTQPFTNLLPGSCYFEFKFWTLLIYSILFFASEIQTPSFLRFYNLKLHNLFSTCLWPENNKSPEDLSVIYLILPLVSTHLFFCQIPDVASGYSLAWISVCVPVVWSVWFFLIS